RISHVFSSRNLHSTRNSQVFHFANPPFKQKSRVFSSQIPHLCENHVFFLQIPHLSKNHAFSLRESPISP
ncbi:hypothetical protein CP8484711_2552, partial [Chlamydia psittaci 84-8471/1]